MLSICRKIAKFLVILSLLTFPVADREEEMAFISHKVSVNSLLSLFAISLLVYCAAANNNIYFSQTVNTALYKLTFSRLYSLKNKIFGVIVIDC